MRVGAEARPAPAFDHQAQRAAVWCSDAALLIRDTVRMLQRILTIAALLSILGGLAWQFRDRLPGRALPALAAPGAAASAGATPRKCVQGGRVLYTDGACPAGSREQSVRDDRVTVVPAMPVPASAGAAGPAASLPNARDLLGRPDDGNLRDKRMERQMNQ